MNLYSQKVIIVNVAGKVFKIFAKVLKNRKLVALADALRSGGSAEVSGLWGSAGPLVAGAVGSLSDRLILFVTSHPDAADGVADDIEVFTGSGVHTFPAWEVDVGSDHVSDEVSGERLRLCNLLSQPSELRDEQVGFIVAPVMALLQGLPGLRDLAASRLEVRKGAQLSPDDLVEWLVDAGFERVDQVDQPRQFARRGGIVDVFAPGAETALRVEFFGDVVESLRRFDLDTLRGTDEIAGYDLIAPTNSGVSAHLMDYLPDETIVCMLEPAEVRDFAEKIYDRIHTGLHDAGAPSVMHHPDEIFDAFKKFSRLNMYTFRPHGGKMTDLGVRSLGVISAKVAQAIGELGELSESAQVWVYCENQPQVDRFMELIESSGAFSSPGRGVNIAMGHVQAGFYWVDEGIFVVGHHEIFHRFAPARRMHRVRSARPIDSMLDLQPGQYVVHVGHGICKFEGLCRLDCHGANEEYLTLRFADNAVLHVPAGQINLVQKYIGAKHHRPSLSKLGGVAWSKNKERVVVAVRDMAAELLDVQAARQSRAGISYPIDTDWQRQFAGQFMYTETEDQLTSMEQIDSDMLAPNCMDRLLCGDVAFGKTELAMRAAFRAVEAGKQVAVLVPTTVLASQHYRTFGERFADYPMRVEMISRMRSKARQGEILSGLKLGQVDILIGTHRLLSGDVEFSDLGLVIIDEEQRFGVEHKNRLKSVRRTVDVLTMTATPIPRTLHMALLGLRDISSLTSPPMDRRAIHTEICRFDDGLIRMAISRELNRRGQVFFVHNRVMDIENFAERVKALAGGASVAIGHGQMAHGQLERTMLKFVSGHIDVLVCTSIIESGLDIPRANTIIIHQADWFGLSELHQLRGRVGRYKRRAYCYLLLPEARPVTDIAARRLKAVEEFSDLGGGFQIAMRDLEIRGAGNILGPQQSGHIAAVGYELYCRLLEQAVRELRGESPPAGKPTLVDIGIDVYIPPGYVLSQRQRMEVYRRLSRCASVAELEQLKADLADVYGPLPPQVKTLLDVATICVRATEMEIASIIKMGKDIVFDVRDMQSVEGIFDGAAGSVRLIDTRTIYWRPPPEDLDMPRLVQTILKQFQNNF